MKRILMLLASMALITTLVVGGVALASVVEGTNSGETLEGTNNPDLIKAFGGRDTLYAKDAADELRAGDGNDKAYGDDGNDTYYGSSGNDVLSEYGDPVFPCPEPPNGDGCRGKEVMFGGEGLDRMQGARNEDELHGGPNPIPSQLEGSEELYGNSG